MYSKTTAMLTTGFIMMVAPIPSIIDGSQKLWFVFACGVVMTTVGLLQHFKFIGRTFEKED